MGDGPWYGICHELRPSESRKFKRLCRSMPEHKAARKMTRARQHKAYLMRNILGFTMEEIGEMFGVSASMASVLVRNGRKWNY